jgi:hypothetical protein
MIVGALLARGSGLLPVSLTMGLGGVIAAAMLFLLPRAQRPGRLPAEVAH